jgi:hypothetical protein
VVRHQAVRLARPPGALAGCGNGGEKRRPVGVVDEDVAAPDPTRGQVVERPRVLVSVRPSDARTVGTIMSPMVGETSRGCAESATASAAFDYQVPGTI